MDDRTYPSKDIRSNAIVTPQSVYTIILLVERNTTALTKPKYLRVTDAKTTEIWATDCGLVDRDPQHDNYTMGLNF